MEHQQTVIAVRGLSKHFGGIRAVDDVSFDVGRGRIAGFLGPNGAGKTTTLRALLGLVRPTAGSALILGEPYGELRGPLRRAGVSLDGNAFVPGRTGRAHLLCYAGPAGAGKRRVGELLSLVDLEGAADRPVGGYSTGMRQRLSLAAALLGEPELLVLDEPSNGLDPDGIIWLRTFLKEFAGSGGTVLLSSHLLGEMQRTIDDVVLVDHGRLVHSGPLEELLHPDQCVLAPEQGAGEKVAAALAQAGTEHRPLPDGRLWAGAGADRVRAVLEQAGEAVYGTRREPCGLEEMFVLLTRAAEKGDAR